MWVDEDRKRRGRRQFIAKKEGTGNREAAKNGEWEGR